MKCYKALRVLERNKTAETPSFSKPIEKLIRFFSKKFPENLGLDTNLSELAAVSNSKRNNLAQDPMNSTLGSLQLNEELSDQDKKFDPKTSVFEKKS